MVNNSNPATEHVRHLCTSFGCAPDIRWSGPALATAPLRRVQVRPLLAEAWGKRNNITIADALYVVLAEHLDADLGTTDMKLAHAAGLSVQTILLCETPGVRVGSLRWWFENRETGKITVAQFPNWPLFGIGFGWVVRRLVDDVGQSRKARDPPCPKVPVVLVWPQTGW